MCSHRRSYPLIVSTAILTLIGFGLSSVGGNPPGRLHSNGEQVLPSASTSVQGDITHTLYCGLWRTDGGFVSTIRIKNSLVVAPLEVSPTLYMEDGTAYPLPPVNLAIAGVATVNVNQALSLAPPSIARHLSKYGSVGLVYRYP